MIVIMQPQATEQDVGQVSALIREMGLKDHVIHGCCSSAGIIIHEVLAPVNRLEPRR